MRKRRTKYDWKIIQKDYDKGLSYRDLMVKYNMSMNALVYAKRRGDIKTRSKSEAISLSQKFKPRTHSKETKKKISESRIKFLNENPDMVPYKLNHSSKMSYPEKRFQDAMIREGISGWTYNYQFGRYCFDFAFPDRKLDVEIDGATHQNEKVKLIDEKRDKNSVDKGWKVLRLTAKEVKSDLEGCIEKLKQTFVA